MINWCVEWRVCLTSVIVFTYHYLCFCLSTITCRSVKHNGRTQINYCTICSLAALLHYYVKCYYSNLVLELTLFSFFLHNMGLHLHRGYEAERHLKTFEQISSVPILCMDCPTGMVALIYRHLYITYLYLYTQMYINISTNTHMNTYIYTHISRIYKKKYIYLNVV